MANRRRLRKVRNFRIRNFHGVGEFIGECAKPRTKNQRNPRPESRLRENEVSRFPCALVLAKRRTNGRVCNGICFSGRNGFRGFCFGSFLSALEGIPPLESE